MFSERWEFTMEGKNSFDKIFFYDDDAKIRWT